MEFSSLQPEMSLPKSGGAIRSIGEKFTLNPATGSGTASIPLAMAKVRGAPELSLNYSSGAGNGPFGLGWSLSIGTISRKTENRLPRYDAGDVFILNGAEDLVETDTDDAAGTSTYQPRTESAFDWIRQFKTDAGTWWLVVTRNNVKKWYGAYPDASGAVVAPSPDAKICDPEHPDHVFQWLLTEERDDRGNWTRYTYVTEDDLGLDAFQHFETNRTKAQPQKYLSQIEYAKAPATASSGPEFLSRLEFDYRRTEAEQTWTARPDPFSNYKPGFDLRTRRLCYRIRQLNVMLERNNSELQLNRETVLVYDENSIATQLKSAFHRYYDLLDGVMVSDDTPAVDFGYSTCEPDNRIRNLGKDFQTGTPTGLNPPYHFIDLDGDGVAGLLYEQANAWYYRLNQGQGRFDPPFGISRPTGWTSLAAGAQVMRLENDGQSYLVDYGSTPGFAAREGNSKWAPFTAFSNIANINMRDPNLRWLDLNGDGKPELCLLHDEVIEWYENDGVNGIGNRHSVPTGRDEYQGPAKIFQNALESIYTADMSGDGLSDILRVRSGDISYWPNLGYGRFGRKITCHNAPTFAPIGDFDPSNLHLADIDGSGTTDLLYLGAEGTAFWLNQSGNGFGERKALPAVPPVDQMTNISLVDLMGDGTNCLVWSSINPADHGVACRCLPLMTRREIDRVDLSSVEQSRLTTTAVAHLNTILSSVPISSDNLADLSNVPDTELVFVEACGGKIRRSCKPYLLERVDNNMGALTRLSYRPSTHFFLEDRVAGRPWITKLPFPVHVVDRKESIDLVSGNRAVSRYSFHHGYYDRAEREFRGFGRVDQWDIEGRDARGDLVFESTPILTRTWFETGAHLAANSTEKQLDAEFFPTEFSLAGNVIEPDPSHSVKDIRQAKRALRGQTLRQEVFACDALQAGASKPTPTGPPYSVTQSRYLVRTLFRSSANTPGVFQTIPDQTLTQLFETNPADPRISHDMTLATDSFGQVTQSAQIAYGRNPEHIALAEQMHTHLLVSDITLANRPTQANDWHRVGLPVSSLSWEVGHYIDLYTNGLATPDDILGFITSSVQPDKYAPLAVAEKRLLSASVQLYRADSDLGLNATPLDFRQVDSLALPCRSYKLVLSPHDGTYFDSHFDDSDFLDAKYLDPLMADHDTLPDLLSFLSGLPESRANRSGWWARDNETSLSAALFFTPDRIRDSWGNETSIALDQWALSPVSMIKHLPNGGTLTTTAETDYRVMAPRLVTDPNGTQHRARFDTRCRVIQSAVSSPQSEGDQLDRSQTFSQSSTGTTWIAYQDFISPAEPAYSHSYHRDIHYSELSGATSPRWTQSRVYSDGFGREALVKAKASPDPLSQAERWLTSAKTIYSNKNNPVMQYEPYFTGTSDYDDGPQIHGVTPVLHYDAMDRVIQTEMPDGTRSLVTFTPWEQMSYDAMDTFDAVLSPEYAEPDPGHLNTPAVQRLDSLGRPFQTEVSNFTPGATAPELAISKIEMDVTGNPLRTLDAKGQTALVQHFDRVGRPMASHSNDAGSSYAIAAMDGQPRIAVLSNGHRILQEYDALRRPTKLWVTPPGGTAYLREAILYNEDAPTSLANGAGQVWRVFDPSGWIETSGYDFKGVPLSTTRHVLTSMLDDTGPSDVTDWALYDLTAPNPLPSESFVTTMQMDALGRPISSTAPDGSTQTFAYDDGGGLAKVDLSLPFGTTAKRAIVKNVEYDSKGRRQSITYGNGTATSYAYDPKTFRLTELKTTRGTDVLQHLNYTYDPLGNITSVIDHASDAVLPGYGTVSPRKDYVYDSLSRLVEASGREHGGQAGWDPRQLIDGLTGGHANDMTQMGRFTEKWQYDEIGNIQRWTHIGAAHNWHRDYTYGVAGSNQLTQTSMTSGGQTDVTEYIHDGAGNITSFGPVGAPDLHIQQSTWNADDQPETMVLHGNKTAHYRYDAGGERVVKRVETSGGYSVRLYLGGFEVFREYKSDGTFKARKDTLHVMDGESRVLMVETVKTTDDIADAETPVERWQLGDHLGSAAMEVDATGQIISIEEFHPYGTTAWHWRATYLSQKRYRYTGMERDAESGLQYHSARYYMPWLGRWLSTDPLGMVDGPSLWAYVRGNPVGLSDQSGEQSVGESTIPEPGPPVSGCYACASLSEYARIDVAKIFENAEKRDIVSTIPEGSATIGPFDPKNSLYYGESKGTKELWSKSLDPNSHMDPQVRSIIHLRIREKATGQSTLFLEMLERLNFAGGAWGGGVGPTPKQMSQKNSTTISSTVISASKSVTVSNKIGTEKASTYEVAGSSKNHISLNSAKETTTTTQAPNRTRAFYPKTLTGVEYNRTNTTYEPTGNRSVSSVSNPSAKILQAIAPAVAKRNITTKSGLNNAVWTEIYRSKIPVVVAFRNELAQIAIPNLARMQNGNAPLVNTADTHKSLNSLILSNKKSGVENADLLDLSNYRFFTPREYNR